MGEFDELDVYGTFTAAEAAKRGVLPSASTEVLEGIDGHEKGFSGAVVEKGE